MDVRLKAYEARDFDFARGYATLHAVIHVMVHFVLDQRGVQILLDAVQIRVHNLHFRVHNLHFFFCARGNHGNLVRWLEK
jgi:hypothetical protein